MRLHSVATLAFSLLFASFSIAGGANQVSNVKCKGGWISKGTGKLEVIAACGDPKYSEVISGANQVKEEKLLYKIKRKNYIFWLYAGKVTRIETPKPR